MLKGYDENGNLRNVKVTEKGEILMKVAGSGDEGLNVNISNADKLATKETTLYAGVANIGVNEITIGVSEKVSEISIANYSETASVSMSVDNKNFVIAPGMALDLPINKVVSIVGLSATEEDTKVQYVLKGFASDSAKYFLPDWSEIGYDTTPESVIRGFNYAKDIYDNWDSSITDMQGKYVNNKQLKYFPKVDTSNVVTLNTTFGSCESLEGIEKIDTSKVTNMYRTFSNCKNLESIPLLNTSIVTNMNDLFNNCSRLVTVPEFDTRSLTSMSNMFSSCLSLSNESLNNILKMCINATSYTDTKTLKYLGLTSNQATICQGLSNYNDFLAAGWTTGY